jgi:hypothetical protein
MSEFETIIGEENFATIEALDSRVRAIRVQNALSELGKRLIIGLSCCGDASVTQVILKAQMDSCHVQDPATPDE